MAEARKKPAIKADKATIHRALTELGVDRPFYTCRVVGSRLEFSLYGGDLVYWPPKPASKQKQARTRKKS